jgi:hypothetical protein
MNLKHFRDNLKSVSNNLNVLLEKHAINNTIVNIDELFGRFALDIIFNVGFQLNYDFLNNPESYEVSIHMSTSFFHIINCFFTEAE